MKPAKVSALRSERGLRFAVRIAEPPVVGLTPQTTNARRTDTMSTYLLRNRSKVQPQTHRNANTRASDPKLRSSLCWTSHFGSSYWPFRFLVLRTLYALAGLNCKTHEPCRCWLRAWYSGSYGVWVCHIFHRIFNHRWARQRNAHA